MATNINKIIKTCKPFWPASAYFVNSATVFVNSATLRGHAPAALPKTKTPSASLRRMNSAESMCLTILSRNTLKFHQVFY